MMRQLTYISTAAPGIEEPDIAAILKVSRQNNARDGITGLLIFDGKRFLQALEGPGPLVEAAFQRIKADPRHRAPVQLSVRETASAEFGHWDMACQRVDARDSNGSLSATVDALVAQVPDANTRALFSGFARIRERDA
jgi:hypothetical protein